MNEEEEEPAFADTAFMPSLAPGQASGTHPASPVRNSIRKAQSPGPAPGSRIGRFVVERKLGEGGMGMVFQARDPDLQRTVAVKLLRPGEGDSLAAESQQRMLREAQAMAMLQHPNLVSIYEAGTHEDDVFLAMEYVVGQTMEDWLAAGQHLEDKLEVFEQAARGLQAVHDAGLVHRDFKPENVMVMADGTAKVLDLGIARRIHPDDVEEIAEEAERKREHRASREEWPAYEGRTGSGGIEGPSAFDSQLTQQGAIVGTPSYMAPEQLLGKDVGPAADQFAFAIALHEALTGARPFAGDSMVEMMANVVADERLPWPEDNEAPAKLREAIDRALATDPAARFPSMSAFFEACKEGLGLRGQIRELTARWLNHDKNPEYLLPEGTLLREGRELVERHPESLSPAQTELVHASWKHLQRRLRARKGLILGVALLLVALVPTLWLVERRSQQLERAKVAGVRAHIGAVTSRVEAVFDRDREQIRLMFEQRGVWAPLAERLFERPQGASESMAGNAAGDEVEQPVVAERETEAALAPDPAQVEAVLAARVLRLNAFFRPVVQRATTISSLMVARDDEAEYLIFEDTQADELTPPYRLYNRIIQKAQFGDSAFQLFFPESGEGPPRQSWLRLGEPDAREQPWTGYTPSRRVWFSRALEVDEHEVAWTDPYLFFVTKDAGVTGSIAFSRGGQRYVFAVDFMLTDLSRITALSEETDFLSFVTDRHGALVALPRGPDLGTLQDVRDFYVEFDRARREALDEGQAADAAAELPRVADLDRPLLTAAFDAGNTRDEPVYSFEVQGETLWAGRGPVGDPERGLTLYVVEAR